MQRQYSLGAASLLALLGCASQQAAEYPSAEAALQALPPNPEACRASPPAIRPVRAGDIPARLLRENRSGWAIVRFSVSAGALSEASVVASSAGGYYNAFAIDHIRNNFNPASPNVTGCLVTIKVTLS